MNLKQLATMAATIVAASSWSAHAADQKCGAGTCGKKEASAKETSCSKKESSCSKKESSCSKKESSCSKK